MLNVTSEIGRLRRVLLHEPGEEVDRMVPSVMEQLLFDDILYGDRARDEHGRFRRVLQLLGAEVVEANDLLVDVLADDEAREWILEIVFPDLAPDDLIRLRSLSAAEFSGILISGSRTKPNPKGTEIEDLYEVPPLPNWCFQRDPQVVLGNGVVFSAMAGGARHREGLLSRALFRFHPSLQGTPVLFDPIETERRRSLFVDQQPPQLEGGDVLVLSSQVIAVGLSERTNKLAVRHMARALARRDDAPRYMVVIDIPRCRAFMHLDTVLTQIDRDACLLHAPVLLPGGHEQASIYEIDLHSSDLSLQPCAALLEQLALRGLDLEPIPCGGDDPIAQRREQWTDGANALALAPGLITLYDRNVRTAEALAQHGFEILEAEDLLLGRSEIDVADGKRVCVMISSNEISRARGGPHCLAHPLVRDNL